MIYRPPRLRSLVYGTDSDPSRRNLFVPTPTVSSRFLPDVAPRPWQPGGKRPLQPVGLFLGNGTSAIEVVVASSARMPGRGAILETWKARRDGRAAPVLLIVLHPNGASVCGATGETPPVYPKVDREQAERLAGEVLLQPDRHAALRSLNQALPSLESALPGISRVWPHALRGPPSGSSA